MRLSPIFIPFAVFLIVAFVALMRVLRFARGIRTTISDGKLGKTLHVETPFGSLDLKPREGNDPILASIPRYPGALPLDSKLSNYDADFSWGSRGGHVASETFCTADPPSAVQEFFQRELPDWKLDSHLEHGTRLFEETAGGGRSLTIHRQHDRTVITAMVTRRADPESGIGPVISSDSTYGGLR